MKTFISIMLAVTVAGNLSSCQESGARSTGLSPEKGMVTGKVTDATGKPLQNVDILLSHTVWSDQKLATKTDENGNYSVTLPAEPRGNWTIKAIHHAAAYGNRYDFVLDANDNSSFGGARGAIRNFTWKLLGEHIGGQYGAEVKVISGERDFPLQDVKLIFSPLEDLLVDVSEAKTIEKNLENRTGQYTAAFIPVGKYAVQAVYKGKTLKLSNTKNAKLPAESVEVNFAVEDPSARAAYGATLYIR
jgi:hypothetical protein